MALDPQLHEIVDIATVNKLVIALAIAAPVIGLLWGVIAGRLHGDMANALKRGLAAGLLGPIVLVMWKFYNYMVRYNPETGYVGLHRMSVYVVNVFIFAIAGVALGLLYSRVWGSNTRHSSQEDN